MATFLAIEYMDGMLRLLDQRALPNEKKYFDCHSLKEVIFAIKDMVVRGAPAIGATAGYGMLIGAKEKGVSLNLESLKTIKDDLDASRPTAVNLMWATERLLKSVQESGYTEVHEILNVLKVEADRIYDEDAISCKKMAEYGNT
ncbi:MAG TPA: S-methyl-5-thioribose-1-phosphate isomerase, partial [Clostridiales bacterium UBA8960]|nr:S-methyl-5-thioribose-1-phosphate isomerase [Clostridiales bacterium UBA8960]